MLKEIYEQTTTVRDTFRSRISQDDGRVDLEDTLPVEIARSMPRICLIACGTSYHAGLVSRFWFEEIAGILCDVEIASEYRYRRSTKESRDIGRRDQPIRRNGRYPGGPARFQTKGLPTLAICNAVGTTMTRDADHTLYTHLRTGNRRRVH